MIANNADARHNDVGYVIHSQVVITRQVCCLRSHKRVSFLTCASYRIYPSLSLRTYRQGSFVAMPGLNLARMRLRLHA